MQFEIITVNYLDGEYNASPDEKLIFNDTKAIEDFLNDKHPKFTSAVVTVLPDKAKVADRATVIEEMALHFENSVHQVWDKDEIVQRLRDFADTTRSGRYHEAFKAALHTVERETTATMLRVAKTYEAEEALKQSHRDDTPSPAPVVDRAASELIEAQRCIARETTRTIRLEIAIRETIKSLEQNSTNAPVIERLRAALTNAKVADRAVVIEGGPDDDWEERGAAAELRATVIEECAGVCEARIHGDDAGSSHYAPYDAEAAGCAKAIRALIGSSGCEGSFTDAQRLDWLEKQAKKSQTGISFDYVPSVEGERSGWRYMQRYYVGLQKSSIRNVIDYVMKLTEG